MTAAPVGADPAAPVVAMLKPNPSQVRLAGLMAVAVYPLITAVLHIVTLLAEGWPIRARTLVVAPAMVISIVFVIAPRVHRHFGWFVARLPRPRR